ncbi:MAG: prepilin-type N-terminal cleavage/methylation domain-containing protein [Acetobacteraceae bacterium]|nr:prepilin-type N-terminal cleavage/methylation domain-containing protein [Acetobacteraceae bacterium]
MRPAPGFTLLEILIAFAIAALALTALTAAVAGSLRSSHDAALTEQAISRARSRLAAAAYDSPGEHSGDDGGGFHWDEIVRPVSRTGSATLYDVTVTVGWSSDGPHRLTLHTLRFGAATAQTP